MKRRIIVKKEKPIEDIERSQNDKIDHNNDHININELSNKTNKLINETNKKDPESYTQSVEQLQQQNTQQGNNIDQTQNILDCSIEIISKHNFEEIEPQNKMNKPKLKKKEQYKFDEKNQYIINALKPDFIKELKDINSSELYMKETFNKNSSHLSNNPKKQKSSFQYDEQDIAFYKKLDSVYQKFNLNLNNGKSLLLKSSFKDLQQSIFNNFQKQSELKNQKSLLYQNSINQTKEIDFSQNKQVQSQSLNQEYKFKNISINELIKNQLKDPTNQKNMLIKKNSNSDIKINSDYNVNKSKRENIEFNSSNNMDSVINELNKVESQLKAQNKTNQNNDFFKNINQENNVNSAYNDLRKILLQQSLEQKQQIQEKMGLEDEFVSSSIYQNQQVCKDNKQQVNQNSQKQIQNDNQKQILIHKEKQIQNNPGFISKFPDFISLITPENEYKQKGKEKQIFNDKQQNQQTVQNRQQKSSKDKKQFAQFGEQQQTFNNNNNKHQQQNDKQQISMDKQQFRIQNNQSLVSNYPEVITLKKPEKELQFQTLNEYQQQQQVQHKQQQIIEYKQQQIQISKPLQIINNSQKLIQTNQSQDPKFPEVISLLTPEKEYKEKGYEKQQQQQIQFEKQQIAFNNELKKIQFQQQISNISFETPQKENNEAALNFYDFEIESVEERDQNFLEKQNTVEEDLYKIMNFIDKMRNKKLNELRRRDYAVNKLKHQIKQNIKHVKSQRQQLNIDYYEQFLFQIEQRKQQQQNAILREQIRRQKEILRQNSERFQAKRKRLQKNLFSSEQIITSELDFNSFQYSIEKKKLQHQQKICQDQITKIPVSSQQQASKDQVPQNYATQDQPQNNLLQNQLACKDQAPKEQINGFQECKDQTSNTNTNDAAQIQNIDNNKNNNEQQQVQFEIENNEDDLQKNQNKLIDNENLIIQEKMIMEEKIKQENIQIVEINEMLLQVLVAQTKICFSIGLSGYHAYYKVQEESDEDDNDNNNYIVQRQPVYIYDNQIPNNNNNNIPVITILSSPQPKKIHLNIDKILNEKNYNSEIKNSSQKILQIQSKPNSEIKVNGYKDNQVQQMNIVKKDNQNKIQTEQQNKPKIEIEQKREQSPIKKLNIVRKSNNSAQISPVKTIKLIDIKIKKNPQQQEIKKQEENNSKEQNKQIETEEQQDKPTYQLPNKFKIIRK